mgnify:CR=1 FL=1
MPQTNHVGEVGHYHPPTAVARHIIQHAIRNIPNKQVLLQKLNPKPFNPLFGLKPHEYNSSGRLQFGFFS